MWLQWLRKNVFVFCQFHFSCRRVTSQVHIYLVISKNGTWHILVGFYLKNFAVYYKKTIISTCMFFHLFLLHWCVISSMHQLLSDQGLSVKESCDVTGQHKNCKIHNRFITISHNNWRNIVKTRVSRWRDSKSITIYNQCPSNTKIYLYYEHTNLIW